MSKVKIVSPDEFNKLIATGKKVALMIKNENCFICKMFEPSLVAADTQDNEIELVAIEVTAFNRDEIVSKIPFLDGVTSVPLFMAFENRCKMPNETKAASWTAIKKLFE